MPKIVNFPYVCRLRERPVQLHKKKTILWGRSNMSKKQTKKKKLTPDGTHDTQNHKNHIDNVLSYRSAILTSLLIASSSFLVYKCVTQGLSESSMPYQ